MSGGMKKHPIETYKHYTLYIVSGITPALFVAEKDDPSKGVTLTADSLEDLKKQIDEKLDYAIKVNINIYQGPECNKIIQKPDVRIKSGNCDYSGFAIVVTCDYDLDEIIELIGKRCIRISKKYRKKHRHINLAKFLSRGYTVHQQ